MKYLIVTRTGLPRAYGYLVCKRTVIDGQGKVLDLSLIQGSYWRYWNICEVVRYIGGYNELTANELSTLSCAIIERRTVERTVERSNIVIAPNFVTPQVGTIVKLRNQPRQRAGFVY